MPWSSLVGLSLLATLFAPGLATAGPLAIRGQRGRGQIARDLHTELEQHHAGMANHTVRVSASAGKIARSLGLPFSHTRATEAAALLHDLGKIDVGTVTLDGAKEIAVPDRLALRLHPTTGLLRFTARFPDGRLSRFIAGGIAAHHERWDGRGYPLGLSGEAIPLSARIIAVADTYDAMTRARGYNRPYSHAEALIELRRAAGTQLDAHVVDAFVRSFETRQDAPRN